MSSKSVKIHAADVDDQNIEDWCVEVGEDEVVPGHVLVAVWSENYSGLYLEPADARTLAQVLIDYANKVEY
jgi:hypothetical protein